MPRDGNNGERIPRRFRAFLREYREDRDSIRVLAESMHSLTLEVRDQGIRFHEAQKETNRRLDHLEKEQARTNQELVRTNQELARTCTQSAKLFGRLIQEVKALRKKP